jgi:hypothetical protein
MKSFFLHLFLLSVLPLTCRTEQVDTNLVDTVLAQAKFQDVDQAKVRIQDALQRAVLVVQATVINSNTVVEASPGQKEVSTGQSWRAASLQVTRALKGDPQLDVILVDNLAFRGGRGVAKWSHPIEATNGQACILILERNEKLSRWCQTNVYAVMEGMEVR